MLPRGSQVIGHYRGTSSDGSLVVEAGSIEAPAIITIGEFGMPGNVSNALATMEEGERRIVKAPFAKRGEKPQIVTYEVNLVQLVRLSAVEDERLHGAECACGCHKLREALA